MHTSTVHGFCFALVAHDDFNYFCGKLHYTLCLFLVYEQLLLVINQSVPRLICSEVRSLPKIFT